MRIEDVETAELDGRLAAAKIDAPGAGDASAAYRIDVRGFAIGRESPVRAIDVRHDGMLLHSIPLEVERPKAAAAHGLAGDARIGFRASLGALRLATHFELGLRALFDDGATAALGTVRGRRASLETGFRAERAPLVLTTLGRTGSMALMRMLEPHPQLLVYKPYRFEQRVATYWLDLLLTVSDPVSYMRQVAPAGDIDDPLWWTGASGPMPWELADSGVEDWLGADGIESFARICQQRIEDVYATIAAQTGVRDAVFFAEKYPLRTAALARELYPDAREIFLVRDFRDMIASILAFNAKRGVQGFGRAGAAGDRDFVLRLGDWADALVRAWERRSERAHLLRYEELVTTPRESARDLLAHLGLGAGDGLLDAMVGALDADLPALADHATAADPRASAIVSMVSAAASPALRKFVGSSC